MNFKEFNQRIDPILCSVEFENEGWIKVTGCQSLGTKLSLTLTINLGEDLGYECWSITAQEVREASIKQDWANDIGLNSEHPLLLPYLESSVELYINAKVEYPARLGVAIYDAHQHFYQGLTTPTPPLFTPEFPGLAKLCNQQSALLAKGPASVINQYAEIVAKYGGAPTKISFPRRGVEQNIDTGLQILIVDRTYIIAESFDFVPGGELVGEMGIKKK